MGRLPCCSAWARSTVSGWLLSSDQIGVRGFGLGPCFWGAGWLAPDFLAVFSVVLVVRDGQQQRAHGAMGKAAWRIRPMANSRPRAVVCASSAAR